MIFLPIYKSTKVYLHYIVLLFRLPICLRVKCDGESLLDTKEVIEWKPKLEYKNRSPVTYDKVWKAVILYHHVYDYFRLCRSIGGDFD